MYTFLYTVWERLYYEFCQLLQFCFYFITTAKYHVFTSATVVNLVLVIVYMVPAEGAKEGDEPICFTNGLTSRYSLQNNKLIICYIWYLLPYLKHVNGISPKFSNLNNIAQCTHARARTAVHTRKLDRGTC